MLGSCHDQKLIPVPARWNQFETSGNKFDTSYAARERQNPDQTPIRAFRLSSRGSNQNMNYTVVQLILKVLLIKSRSRKYTYTGLLNNKF